MVDKSDDTETEKLVAADRRRNFLLYWFHALIFYSYISRSFFIRTISILFKYIVSNF